MQEGDRTAWYKAALMTIGDMPLLLLKQATAEARRVCDHPAKIVPFICKFQPDTARLAKENLRYARAAVENLHSARLPNRDPEYMTVQDLAEMKAELAIALSTNW